MACSGHTNAAWCVAHDVGICPTHNASICPTHNASICPTHVAAVCTAHAPGTWVGTPTAWTDVPLSTSVGIKVQHHNELRTAINAELIRRSKAWVHDPGAVNTAISVLSSHIRDLRNGINSGLSWAWPATMNDAETEIGDSILALQYSTMRDRVNYMELECLCNCNYACTCLCNYACTCDCNVCSCNCNYCTCACNYCTCNCNYNCTCNCNY